MWALVAWQLLPGPAAGADDASERMALDHFENSVRPLLEAECIKCHGPRKQKGGLRLDTPAAVMAGGEGGPVIRQGDPDASRLIQAVRYLDQDLQMPPRSRLLDDEISALVRWVQDGAAMPSHSEEPGREEFDLEERLSHWSFQPITRSEAPEVLDTSWPRDELDRFLLARLEAEGIRPATDAAPADWLRRVSFDLCGLPPTTAELEEFLADGESGARERVVDRLLDSPHFGERWGRHWLDLMRYAETRGHEFDIPIPNAWHYRDYVIRAFNADVPYDRFIQEHVAGDLIEPPRPNPERGFDESLLGTSFWFLGDGVHSPVDIRADETDRVANQVDVLSRAFLGLTVACARCHDHKFDPISAEDYYALSGFPMGGSYRQARFVTEESDAGLLERILVVRNQHQEEVTRTLEQALEHEIERISTRIQAATEFIERAAAPMDQLAPEKRDMLALEIALAHDLVAEDLLTWIAEIESARSSGDHRLHPLLGPDLGSPQHSSNPSSSAELEALFVSDERGAPDLLTDGSSAGHSALRSGTLLLGSDPRRPVLGVMSRDGLHFDPIWNRHEFEVGHQGDSEATKGILPGRMFRTPTFELSKEKVSVLVRGQGFVYAAVDSHRVIRGPLHGELCKTIDTQGRFEWVELSLGNYLGHRLHLEFSPARGDDVSFAVGGFRQGSTSESSHRPPTDFDSAHGRFFGAGVAAEADLELLDWMLQRPDLFPLEHQPYREAGSAYAKELNALLEAHEWSSPTAPVMLEGSGIDEHVLSRGSPATPGEVAERRFLEGLDGKQDPVITHGSGRLELALRLTAPSNHFLPRVWVNRLWHHLFGQGIVISVDDFGAMGLPPSHPELLDNLASALVEDGWSTKRMIRRLVLSRAYGMSSRIEESSEERDPENLWLHRMPVKRIDAESLRDSILAVSGTLDRKLYGPSIPVHLTPFLEGRGRPATSGPLDGAGRRSIYLAVCRNFLAPFLSVFDFPNPSTTIGRRTNSNVPAQALTLLNDPFVHQEAERWAHELLKEHQSSTSEQRITVMYMAALARPPEQPELEVALDFLVGQEQDPQAWADLGHVLYNLKEFRYLR